MPREQHSVVQSLASARYLPMVSNPLLPIVDRFGELFLAIHPQRRTDDRKNANFRAERAALQEEFHQRLLLALDQLLMAESAASTALRKNLIALLATREVDRPAIAPSAPKASTEPVEQADPFLTTAEVAERLEVSRPYVVMLCNWGRLGEVIRTEGGHRRIRRSEVEAYLVQREKEIAPAKGMSPREAGVAAGLYDWPEIDHRDVVRVQVTADGRPVPMTDADALKGQVDRASRSRTVGAKVSSKKAGRKL